MSVRLDTIPRLTKNFAGGSDDTRAPRCGTEGRERGRSGRWGADPAGRDGTASPRERACLHVDPWRPVGDEAPRIIGPMLLAVDVGNTNVTIGLVRGRRRSLATRRAATRAGATADELELLLDGLLAPGRRALADVRRSRCCSVVPVADGQALDDSPRDASARCSSPRPGTCRSPSASIARQRSGADRLVNALAAHRLYGGAGGRRRLRDRHDRRLPSPPTAPSSAARSRRASSWASTRWRRGPRSCRGSSSRRPTARSAATPSRAIQAGAVLGYQALSAGLLARDPRPSSRDATGIAPRPTSRRS